MSFDTFSHIPPVDVELVDKIVCKLKSQGIFDEFRKDCLADVDTKPAYQNLQQRVNGTVASFLANHTWQEDLNKTQLRESLRRHVQQGFLEMGVERIVEQVVNPKIVTVFMPRVEDVVYECLGVEKPRKASPLPAFSRSAPPPFRAPSLEKDMTKTANKPEDILPDDLDPISPGSDDLDTFDNDETLKYQNVSMSLQDIELPKDESQNDTQLSGISELSSHSSIQLKEQQSITMDSKISSSTKVDSTLQFDNFTNLSEKIKKSQISQNLNNIEHPKMKQDSDTSDNFDIKTDPVNIKDEEMSNQSLSTFDGNKSLSVIDSVKEESFHKSFSDDSISSFANNIKIANENTFLKESEENPKEVFSVKEMKTDEIESNITNKERDNKDEPQINNDFKKNIDSNSKKERKDSDSSSKHKRASDTKHRSSHHDKKTYKHKEKSGSSKNDKHKSSSSSSKDNKHRSEKDKEKYIDKNKEVGETKIELEKSVNKEDKVKIEKPDKNKDHKQLKDKEKNYKSKSRADTREKVDKYKPDNDHEKKKDNRKNEKHHSSSSKKDDKNKSESEKDKNEKTYEGSTKHRQSNHKSKTDDKKESKERKRKGERCSDDSKSKEGRRSWDRDNGDGKGSSGLKKEGETRDRKEEGNTESSFREGNSGFKKGGETRERKEGGNTESSFREERRAWDRDDKECSRLKTEEESEDRKEIENMENSWEEEKMAQKHNGNYVSDCTNTLRNKAKEEKMLNIQQDHNELMEYPANNKIMEESPLEDRANEVDMILMKINFSIEEDKKQAIEAEASLNFNKQTKETQEVEMQEIEQLKNEEKNNQPPLKKPKIAKNIFEIRKIMQARKNIAKKITSKNDKKNVGIIRKTEVEDIEIIPASTEMNSAPIGNFPEDNKENINEILSQETGNKTSSLPSSSSCLRLVEIDKTGQSTISEEFRGFSESEIKASELAYVSLKLLLNKLFQEIGKSSDDELNITQRPHEHLESNIFDALDNNLSNRCISSLDNSMNIIEEKQIMELMSGRSGCYVLLDKNCPEVTEAVLRNEAENTEKYFIKREELDESQISSVSKKKIIGRKNKRR